MKHLVKLPTDILPLQAGEARIGGDVRIPAFSEFPITSVVHPAYHARPNGGQGSFLPSASRRFSCVRVLATRKQHKV